MLDNLVPKPTPGWRLKQRRDATAGVCDDQGASAELAADEAALLGAIDGQRSLTAIAETGVSAHGFVPFTALRDLMGTLADSGLLSNAETDLRRLDLKKESPWFHRLKGTLARIATPLAGRLSFAGAVALVLATWVVATVGPSGPGGLSVVLSYFGAALALSARASFRGAALATAAQPPRALQLTQTAGVLAVGPDGSSAVLLERGARVGAHLAALAGALAVGALGWENPGLRAGAMAVVLADLCPFLPTSASHILSALSGHVDLSEHARAYLTRRVAHRAVSSYFEGEGFLVSSLVLSLGWFAAVVRVLWTDGVLAVLLLVRASLDETLPLRLLSYLGAIALVIAMPTAIAAMLWGLTKAIRSAFPSAPSSEGTSTGNTLDSADFSEIPLFSALDAPHQTALARAARETRYAPDELFVRQGETGDTFYAIRTGQVVVVREAPSGLRQEIARLGPGDCFGEVALLEAHPRMASVRATQVTVVAQISRKAFREAVADLGEDRVTGLIRSAAALHKSRFFSRLPTERLSSLAARLRPRTVSSGDVVIRAGDSGDEFFLVGSGAFEVTDSRGASVATLKAGDHFGEVALLRNIPRTATVKALEDAFVFSLSKKDFLSAMASDLALSSTLEVVAAERTGRLT